MNFQKTFIAIMLISIMSITKGQNIAPDDATIKWTSSWIQVPGTDPTAYGIYIFRKQMELKSVPENFTIYISADNRYKLYVNEKLVSIGPSKSDIEHWNFEKVNLVPYLKVGKNIVAVKVWNEGKFKPEFQISLKSGLIIKGANKDAGILNTNKTWKCIQDTSYSPLPVSPYGVKGTKITWYYVAGPGENIEMQKHIKDWEKLSFNDNQWKHAEIAFEPGRVVWGGVPSEKSWNLTPSLLPPMELTYQRLSKVRLAEGLTVPSNFPSEKAKIEVPSNTKASLLLDQGFLTNAFPTVVFSGGENSVIKISYSEALYEGKDKNNRNVVEGKIIAGRNDVIVSDGTSQQNFTSLAYRTFRYIKLEIETRNSPLSIDDLYGTFTAYPFQLNALLKTNIKEIQEIYEIGWRTARLCAFDTYFDCPYYEQLQYIGDTRIQAMVSLYNSGDDRLIKNALNLFDYSRQQDGYTLSRYPTGSEKQIIPPFSLYYIGMLRDYLMYGSDQEFIKGKLTGSRQILNYFIGLQSDDGSLKKIPGWNFSDWAEGWKNGIAPCGKDESSALLDLQFLLGLQAANEIEKNIGRKEFSLLYENIAKQLTNTIKQKYWDESKKLVADTPEKDKFSQQTNALAILAGIIYGKEAEDLGTLLLSDSTLTQASIYFKYYMHQALVKAGLGDGYLSWLDIWRENIELGMTTWGEDSNVKSTRSDCHAWGASPNIEFFRTILGIDSDAPGFSKVKIEPHLGEIKSIGGEMPHPNGKIAVNYELKNKQWDINIRLPEGITGVFIWKDKSYQLKPGENGFQI
ncbi:MAG: alpha-rhamnosidase [Bacteroidales bacterium]|nr:alpha-rhamnosidase [Bacteroidales bacterium]